MKPGMKMLMIANRDGDGRRSGGRESERRGGARSEMNYPYYRGETEYETTRNEYNGSDMNYGVEGRFRGDGGYSNYRERLNPNSDYEIDDRYGAENRRGGRRYSRDERGRFTPRSAYGMDMGGYDDMNSHYPMTPLVPPVYENDQWEERRPMNRIGFSDREEMNQEYRSAADYPRMNEMEHRTSPKMMGYARGSDDMKLTREMADEWMAGLQNEDGTKGPHWTFEQVKQVMAQKGISNIDPICMWVVMNMMYSDYCKVFKKYGVGDKLDFFVDISKSFIEDKDAGEGKVANYFHSIVKH